DRADDGPDRRQAAARPDGPGERAGWRSRGRLVRDGVACAVRARSRGRRRRFRARRGRAGMVAAGGIEVSTRLPGSGPALRLGTRRSRRARTQSAHVAELLTARTGRQVELVGLTSFGDVSRAALAQIGGTGVFVSELRARLLDGQID